MTGWPSGSKYALSTKNLAETNTSLTLSTSHYTTHDFYSFSEANDDSDPDQHVHNRRNRTQFSLTQDLGALGNISASFTVRITGTPRRSIKPSILAITLTTKGCR